MEHYRITRFGLCKLVEANKNSNALEWKLIKIRDGAIPSESFKEKDFDAEDDYCALLLCEIGGMD